MRTRRAGGPVAAALTLLVVVGLVGAVTVPVVLLVVFAPMVGIPVAAGLAVLLVAGIGVTWVLSGWGGVKRRLAPPGAPAVGLLVGSGMWRVLEPGAHLCDPPGGEPVAWLGPGTVVTEQERQGEKVRVATLRGTVGWVDADRLEPPDTGAGEGGG